MQRLFAVAALVVALAIPSMAMAATLSKGQGATCNGTSTWLFVNKKTIGAPAGELTAYFSGGITATTGPSAVFTNKQEFYVETIGTGSITLINAVTNLPGNLVLQRVTC